jgi:hypothetical protein
MFMNDVEGDLVTAIFRQMPLLLVYFAGLIFAMVFWRRQPLACALVLTGSGLLLLAQIVNIGWECIFIPELAAQNAIPDWMDDLVIYGLPYLGAIGTALLISAAFVGRRERLAFRRMPEDD